MPRNASNALLAALAGRMGLPGLALDDNDAAQTMINEALFAFAHSDEAEDLAAIAFIGPLPEGAASKGALRLLMEGNYAWAGTGGGILGLDEDTGHICLSARFPLEGTTEAAFLERIAVQADLTAYWRKTLRESAPTPDTGPERAPDFLPGIPV